MGIKKTLKRAFGKKRRVGGQAAEVQADPGIGLLPEHVAEQGTPFLDQAEELGLGHLGMNPLLDLEGFGLPDPGQIQLVEQVGLDQDLDEDAARLRPETFEERVASPVAMERLARARAVIEHVNKNVFRYGAGNQEDDVRGTRGVSRLRTADLRNPSHRDVEKTQEEWLAGQVPGAEESRVAYQSQYWGAGACDDYAMVVFDWLRTNAPGVPIERVGSDSHAFVLLGELGVDRDEDIVVADPWPTRPQACLWTDHFLYDPAPGEGMSHKDQMVGDGVDRSAAARGEVTLTKEKERAKDLRLSPEATQDMIEEAWEKHDMWEHRYTTESDHYILYVDPGWSARRRRQERQALSDHLEHARHLGPHARKHV